MGVHTAYEPGDVVLIKANVLEIRISQDGEIYYTLGIETSLDGEKEVHELFEWQIAAPVEELEANA